MSIQSKVDDWLTAGNNWRFIALVGVLVLIVIALVFGTTVKSRIGLVAVKPQINKVAKYVPPPKAETPPEPEPVPESSAPTWMKSVMCNKEGCWDIKTNRKLYLGERRK